MAKHNINVNAVAPGDIETELVSNLISRCKLKMNELIARTPSGKLASAEDVPDTVVFLCSEESKHIIGQTIVVAAGPLTVTWNHGLKISASSKKPAVYRRALLFVVERGGGLYLEQFFALFKTENTWATDLLNSIYCNTEIS